MKFKAIMASAVAMLSLAACSSDEPANKGGGTEGGTSYLNVSINLPSVDATGSRSNENDQFDDGEASEYRVNKAHLVIFEGETEAAAKVKNIYEMTTLKPWNLEGTTTDNVTTTAQTVQQINDAPADNLWVLIVLNDNDALTHFAQGKTFAELTGVASEMDFCKNGIFMTNAPLFTGTGARTLVKITKEDIKSTQEAALASPAVNIYVERGVAKVQLLDKNAGESNLIKNIPSINGEDAQAKNYVAEIQKWAIDITNNKSFIVRNVSEFANWKDLASKITGAMTGTRFYSSSSNRIYWAIDPNYDEYKRADFYSLFDDDAKESKFTNEPGGYVYCRENTFDVANQNRNQTTRLIIKATFKPVDAENASTFYTLGASNTIYDAPAMRKFVTAKAVELLEDKKDAAKYTVDGSETVSKTRGDHSLATTDVKYDGVALSQAEIDILNNAIGTIHTYLNGECFYVARVKHFGDTYTPWISGSPAYGETDRDDNYLGRYGIVRNNWYALEVSGIATLGNPDVPETPTTPDDENKYFISVKCNVHSWAKRVQDVKL